MAFLRTSSFSSVLLTSGQQIHTADSPLVLLYNLEQLHAGPLDGVEHLWSGIQRYSPVIASPLNPNSQALCQYTKCKASQ